MTWSKQRYGRPLSSVFGYQEKGGYRNMDEDQDPSCRSLRTVDYRYITILLSTPVKDKFLLGNTWKDPQPGRMCSQSALASTVKRKDYRRRVFWPEPDRH